MNTNVKNEIIKYTYMRDTNKHQRITTKIKTQQ